MCTGTEEFCRRACIIDPTQCGTGGNASPNPAGALAEEMRIACAGDGHDEHNAPNWHRLAAHLLATFSFGPPQEEGQTATLTPRMAGFVEEAGDAVLQAREEGRVAGRKEALEGLIEFMRHGLENP